MDRCGSDLFNQGKANLQGLRLPLLIFRMRAHESCRWRFCHSVVPDADVDLAYHVMIYVEFCDSFRGPVVELKEHFLLFNDQCKDRKTQFQVATAALTDSRARTPPITNLLIRGHQIEGKRGRFPPVS